MGYRILRKVDLSSASVLEVGPGDILHMDQWQGVPKRFVIADVQQAMLDRSAARLVERKVCFETKLMARTDITSLPFNTAEFDYILSFYSLEHLYPLESTLAEFARVLRPGGKLVGSIPAEGGLAWGMGRFLTTRRWLKKHTTIDPDKIICWEHPNFADHILRLLDRFFVRQRVTYRPFCIPSIDLNLVISFIFERK
ncbi:MAG TPA: class I SAM-dependent methyltransferase [Gemmataceae bacterium]|nr:class I SAM-dependent methyltransferase [Gemmataceae bacterium]